MNKYQQFGELLSGIMESALVKAINIAETLECTSAYITKLKQGNALPSPEQFQKILHLFRSHNVSEPHISQLIGIYTQYRTGIKVPAEYNNSSKAPDTILNTPELRLCIKDAMMAKGLTSAADLTKYIGYDSVHSIERLLSGKLNWFPDVLSAVLENLGVSYDDAPISPAERLLLLPSGTFNNGGLLLRPIPVVDWANAACHLNTLSSNNDQVMEKWDPDSVETITAPVGTRKGTQAFRVYGESMEPTILDGEIIFCEPYQSTQDIPNGKVVIVKFSEFSHDPDTIVCKRFQRDKNTIILTSDNAAEGKIYTGVTPQDIAWIGIVNRKVCEI